MTIPDMLMADEVAALEAIFDRFVSGEIAVPGKDFCDMSKPFDTPYDQWSIVNCMLPSTYYPPLQGNPYERLTESMARQLFASAKVDNNGVLVLHRTTLLLLTIANSIQQQRTIIDARRTAMGRSEAEQLFRFDMDEGKHTTSTPFYLYCSRSGFSPGS